MGFLVFDGTPVDAVLITAANRGDEPIRVGGGGAFWVWEGPPGAVGLTTPATGGEEPIRVSGSGLVMQDGSGRTMVNMHQMPGVELPGVIAPKDSAMTYFHADEAARA